MGDAADEGWLRRLVPRFDPAAWMGLVVKVVPAATHETQRGIVGTPDHFLAAAWLPPAQALSRWPEIAVIGSPRSDNALTELFLHLPPHARLHLASPDEVDAALAARILRDRDRNLEPYQRDALDAFIAAEERREAEAIRTRFSDRDAGFERFRNAVIAGPAQAT